MLLTNNIPGRIKCAASIKESDDDEQADTSRRRLHRAITAVSTTCLRNWRLQKPIDSISSA